MNVAQLHPLDSGLKAIEDLANITENILGHISPQENK